MCHLGRTVGKYDTGDVVYSDLGRCPPNVAKAKHESNPVSQGSLLVS